MPEARRFQESRMPGNPLVRFDEGRVGRTQVSPSLLLYRPNVLFQQTTPPAGAPNRAGRRTGRANYGREGSPPSASPARCWTPTAAVFAPGTASTRWFRGTSWSSPTGVWKDARAGFGHGF